MVIKTANIHRSREMNSYVLCHSFCSCQAQIGNSRLLTTYFRELLNNPLQGLMLPSGILLSNRRK